jgi:hypothetical protein
MVNIHLMLEGTTRALIKTFPMKAEKIAGYLNTMPIILVASWKSNATKTHS